MRYRTAASLRTALEERLNQRARQGESLVLLRKKVAFERLLARLCQVAPGRWVLKGALALDFRLGGSRTTKDLDLARTDDLESAVNDMLDATGVGLGDHFQYSILDTESDMIDEPLTSRIRLACELAGRPFETLLVDIGFSDPILWSPGEVTSPGLLTFAGFEPFAIPCLPLEQQIAEKVHAYCREYGRSQHSSRVKDLVDLQIIGSSLAVEGERLREALIAVFAARGKPALPERLPPPPENWARPYARLAAELQLPPSLEGAYRAVSRFVDPGLAGQARGRWNPDRGEWNEEPCRKYKGWSSSIR